MAQMISCKYARANCSSVEEAVLAIIDFLSDFWLETGEMVLPVAILCPRWFIIKLGEREVFCDFIYHFDMVEKMYEMAYGSFIVRAGLELNFHAIKFDRERSQLEIF